jgi:hypothetical protein
MHVQAAVDGFDVFARSLTIGAETKVMWFEPHRPLHDRYQVRHDFLPPELGFEVETISKLVDAFFRWEFNSCESLVRGGEVFPIDYANAAPDVALTSLHYYFPWAITALVRWCAFCLANGRRMRIDVDAAPWFEIGDRDDSSCDEKLHAYRGLADEYFEADAYAEICAGPLRHLDDAAHDWFSGGTSTACWSTPCARRSPPASTSSSSRATAGCSPPGRRMPCALSRRELGPQSAVPRRPLPRRTRP